MPESLLDGYLRPISNSEVREFKRCRRKWWLGQFRRLRPRRGDELGVRRLGDRLHAVLAAYYDPAQPTVSSPDDALKIWDVTVVDDLATWPDLDKEVRKEHDLGRAVLEGYFQWLEEEGVDQDLEVVGAERMVAVPFNGYTGPRPVVLVAKQDLRVRRKSNGARAFMDHKSVQNLTDLPKVADLDEQFMHYSLLDYLDHLAKGEDTFVDGGIFNLLRKVKRTATAKPPFFGRVEVRFNVGQLRSYWLRLAGEVMEIQRAEDRLRAGEDPLVVAFPTPSRDCSWDCDFRAVCPMLDDPASRAEDFLREAYEEGDPYARYQTKETQ